jgi:hypothetical protein
MPQRILAWTMVGTFRQMRPVLTSLNALALLLVACVALPVFGQTRDVEGMRKIPIKNRRTTDKPAQDLSREMPGNAPIKYQDFQRYKRDEINRVATARPTDYALHTEEGDMIEVRHERFHTGEALDRCEIEFKVASAIRVPKIFVLSDQPFVIDPRKPGGLKKTIFTQYDYESFDKQRPSTVNGERRTRPFFNRVRPAGITQRQIAFYRTGQLLKSTRARVKTQTPLEDVLSPVDIGRETFITLHPGYRITLTWMTE